MKQLRLLTLLLVIVLALAACGGGDEPEVAEDAPAAETEEEVPAAEVEEEAPAEPEGPTVGGTLVYQLQAEPNSLDNHRENSGSMYAIMRYVGASLVTKDPSTNEYIPYLAESWTVAEDGMFWEFKLREDVLFHDGTPLTAHDYVWTFERIMDPETMSPSAAAILRGVAGTEAVDDYTFRINMSMSNYSLLENMTSVAYMQPLLASYVEQVGDDEYGRSPMSVGPYKFKEWVTGEKIVLERNPDFAWGPAFTSGSAPYIENIEFRIIPEYATALAGLEAGEIDYMPLETKDLERVQDADEFQILYALTSGVSPYVSLNVSQPPFDDVLVRQAFNYAVDREVIIKIVALGHAEAQQGPISPPVNGYWDGVEEIGYSHDLDKARALMEEAGYTYNDAGMLEKDGEPFKLVLKGGASTVDLSTILQEQFKALGLEVEIESNEQGVLIEDVRSGNYTFSIYNWGWADSSLMFGMFHSSMVGGINTSQVNDPDLDSILGAMFFATSDEANEEAAINAQRYIVEKSLIIPLYASKNYRALSSNVQGAAFSVGGVLHLFDAYIVDTE